jgi:hypothetical protein
MQWVEVKVKVSSEETESQAHKYLSTPAVNEDNPMKYYKFRQSFCLKLFTVSIYNIYFGTYKL